MPQYVPLYLVLMPYPLALIASAIGIVIVRAHLRRRVPPRESDQRRKARALLDMEWAALIEQIRQMGQDKLLVAIEAIRQDPTLLDDEARLAQILGLRRPASARFWKIKAREILRKFGYIV
jgi:cell division protein FtsL